MSSLYFQKPLYELNVFKGENGRCSLCSKCFRILSFVDYSGLCLFMCLLVRLILLLENRKGNPQYGDLACWLLWTGRVKRPQKQPENGGLADFCPPALLYLHKTRKEVSVKFPYLAKGSYSIRKQLIVFSTLTGVSPSNKHTRTVHQSIAPVLRSAS